MMGRNPPRESRAARFGISWPGAVLWQIGENHAVGGEHGMNGIGEGLNNATQEVDAVHLSCVVAKLDLGELGSAVDRKEHVELALGQAQITDIDMHVANLGEDEFPAFRGSARVHRSREIPWRSM